MSVLGDVSDEYHRYAALLCQAQQPGGAFPYLGDGAGGGLHAVRVDGLYRVHYEQVRSQFLRVFDDVVHKSLAQYGAVVLHLPVLLAEQPHGSQLYLARGFLARDIEGAQTLAPERYLQGQGGLADARLAS